MSRKVFGEATYIGTQHFSRIGAGNSAAALAVGPDDVCHIVSDNDVGLGGQIIERAYSDAAAATAIFFRKARNTIASKQAVQVGDRVLGLVCSGWDGSAYVSGAILNTEARVISSGICSQDFVWRQQPAAGGALVETMRLAAAGNLSVFGNAFVDKNNPAGTTYMAARNLVAGTGGAAAFFAQSDSAYIEFTAYSSTFSAGTVGGEAMADAIRVTDAPSIPASKFMLGTTGASPLHLITNDVKRITIDSAGLVGIGTAIPWSKCDVVGWVTASRFSDDSVSNLVTSRKARGTEASPAGVQLNDELGRYAGYGYAPTLGWNAGAEVRFRVAATWSATSTPSEILFYTIPVNGVTLTERMRITNDGLVGIGTTPVTDLDITKSVAGAFVYSRLWNNNAAANSDAQAQVLSSGGSASLQLVNYDSGAKAWSIGNARSFGHQLLVGKSTGITGNLAIALDYNDGLSEGRLGVNKTSPGYPLDVLGKAAVSAGLGVWGKTPPAAQPAKINDPSGGGTIDAEARTAINAIIDVLEGAGLSAAV